MKRKAQAAMEFLMTYGWAILVVIAAIAALAYFGVLDPSNLLPEKCEFAAGITCVGGKAAYDDTADTVTFPLKNNQGFEIILTDIVSSTTGDCGGSVTSFRYKAPYGTWGSADGNQTLQNNEQAVAEVTCVLDAGRFDETFTVTYVNSETTLEHPAVGVIRGRVV